MIALDTNALVWWVSDPQRVPGKARRLLDTAVSPQTATCVRIAR